MKSSAAQLLRSVCVIGASALVAEAQTVTGVNDADRSEVAVLTTDAPLGLMVSANEAARLRLALPRAGHWVLSIDQANVDVTVELLEPSGESAGVFDAPGERRVEETVYVESKGPSTWAALFRPLVKYPAPRQVIVSLTEFDGEEPDKRSAIRLLSRATIIDDTAPRSDGALPGLYGQALAAAERSDDASLLARVHIATGAYRLYRNEPQGAIDSFQSAHRLLPDTLEQGLQASLLHFLGYAYVFVADYSTARGYIEQAISLQIDREPRFFRLQSMNNLCWLEQSANNIAEAAACYRSLLAELRDVDEPTLQAAVLNNLIGVSLSEGAPEGALRYAQHVIPLREQLGVIGELATAYNNMGLLYRRMNEIQAALEHYQIALRYRRLDGDVRGIGNTLNNIGYLYLTMGDLSRAERYFEEALPLRRQSQHAKGEARTLSNLGSTVRQSGQFDRADDLYREALQIWRRYDDQRGICRTTTELAQNWRMAGRATEAVADLSSVEVRCSEASDRRTTANFLLEYGLALALAGQNGEADRHLRLSLSMFSELRDAIGIAAVHRGLSAVAKSRGDEELALDHALDAIASIDSVRAAISSSDVLTNYSAVQQEVYDHAIGLLMGLSTFDEGRVRQALALVEKNKARTLGEVLHWDHQKLLNTDSDELVSQYLSVKRHLADLSYRLRRATDATSGPLATEFEFARTEFDEVEGRLRGRSPAATDQSFDLAEFQSKLQAGELVLVYWVGVGSGYVWKIDHRDVSAHKLPSKERLRSMVQKVNQSNRAQSHLTASSWHERQALSAELLGDDTLEQYDRVYVVADDALHNLAFAALPAPAFNDRGGVPLLIDYLELTMMPAMRYLNRPSGSAASEPGTGRLVVFADPVYSHSDERVTADAGHNIGEDETGPSATWPRLRGTMREAASVVELYGLDSAVLHSGFEANRDVFLRERYQPDDILHVAAHAVTRESSRPLSGIVLSTVDEHGRPVPAVVDYYDLYGLPAPGLVVLSACDTALGESVPGEGVIGIARALMYSGTDTVIASLWPAGDTVTANLMARLHAELKEGGKSPAAALRAAQLALRNGDRRFRDPQHWANFVVIGRSKPSATLGGNGTQNRGITQ